jgi:hypothetical protein
MNREGIPKSRNCNRLRERGPKNQWNNSKGKSMEQ